MEWEFLLSPISHPKKLVNCGLFYPFFPLNLLPLLLLILSPICLCCGLVTACQYLFASYFLIFLLNVEIF